MHLWVVGVAALLWNAIGATDYVMTRTRNEHYLNAVMPDLSPQVMLAYVDSMPLPASIGWGFGVWGALIGTLFLLARSRHAVIAYLLSLIGAVVSFAYQFTVSPPPKGMDDPIMPIVITVIAIGLLLYARWMRSRGVLR